MKILWVATALCCVSLIKADEVVDDDVDAIVITAPSNARRGKQLLLNYATPMVKMVDYPGLASVQYPILQTRVAQDCTTSQGLKGRCMTLNECYPNRKIFRLKAHETWAMGLYNTCGVQSARGVQVYGTCCPQDKAMAERVGANQRSQANPGPRAQACLLDGNQKSRVKSTRCKKNNSGERTVRWRQSSWDPTRIVNGEQAIRGEYPFIAALLATDSSGSKRQFCGGSLIDEYHVLTAAHCVIGYTERDINMLRVRLGAHWLSSTGQTSEHKVDRIIRHIDFKQTTLDYDVAILTLSTPANTGASNIDRICLPSVGIDYNQYQAVVAGWGSTKATGFSQPDELKKVIVQIWDNPKCSRSYGSDAPGGITARMMCANLPGRDSCQGDSGGPLFTCDGSNQCTQIGIVSWGISCAHEKYPGVYSRVTALQEWIDRITSCY